MKNLDLKFNSFLNIALKILFLVIVFGSIIYLIGQNISNFELDIKFTSIFLIIYAGIIYGTYLMIKKKVKKAIIIPAILIVAIILRVAWFFNIDSIPIGDFNRMFICGGDFLEGSVSMFRGTAYMARFPHMSMTVLYYALIRGVFSNPLVAIKLINIVYSVTNVIILYFIARQIFKDEKKSIWVMLIAAIFPAMIAFNNVYASENLAMPLLLLSVLFTFKAFNSRDLNKKNSVLYVILSGIFISLTHLFRPVGYVTLVAFLMFLVIYFKGNIKEKILLSGSIIIAFALPYIIVSYSLMALNITENPLWHGTEPPSISMLKGCNIEAEGRWNQEDAELFDKCDRDYEKVDKAAKEIIKQRFKETPIVDWLKFYTFKYATTWTISDFAGVYWSEIGLDEAYNKDEYIELLGKDKGNQFIDVGEKGTEAIQFFYIIIIILVYKGLYTKKEHRNLKLDLLYIMFCGMSIQCLILEGQDRYAYPYSWIFIVLAVGSFAREKKLAS